LIGMTLLRWAAVLAASVCLAASGGQAFAAPDRAEILGFLCSPAGRDVPEATRQIMTNLPDASAADLAWDSEVALAFGAKKLACSDDGKAFLERSSGSVDAATLAPVTGEPDDAHAPLPSLRTRGLLQQLSAAIELFAATSPADQLAALAVLQQRSDGLPPGLLQAAQKRDLDGRVAEALRSLVLLSALHASDTTERVAAIDALGGTTTGRTATQLKELRADRSYAADPRVAAALDKAIGHVDFWLGIGSALSLLYNGISAGSVLFMSAIGLAIIFGLMGVINLAQGELIMIGAYTTYVVQQLFQSLLPSYIAWYPIVSMPVVFIVSAAIGVAMEATVIRHLYKRPLMTLLATWAISLLLTNLVRVTFGTQNLEFVTPAYLTGGIPVVGDFFITWNHLGSIAFAVLAFLGTFALLKWTSFGLFVRGVTQNRDMAGCVGVSTRRIDMMAFGFGAGLAGLGGLALSPIYNVNPSMGTQFIIDSFMVVVLGGVGSLVGTAVAALGIGLVNVGIEPFYGAVAAKVIALLLIILLIQWRPEGLVTVRGRR
jgi:urea transport system permease protein